MERDAERYRRIQRDTGDTDASIERYRESGRFRCLERYRGNGEIQRTQFHREGKHGGSLSWEIRLHFLDRIFKCLNVIRLGSMVSNRSWLLVKIQMKLQ